MNRYILFAGLLTLMPLAPAGAWTQVQAQQSTLSQNAGSGPGSIVIQGGTGQPLTGRTFLLYRLFDAEQSAGKESVRYRWAPETESALRQAVAQLLKTEPESVTEAEAVDCVANLKEDPAAMRRFLETVRDLLDPAAAITVTAQTVGPDNALTITGLPYGWYLADEQGSAVAGSHAAAALLMVDTVLPEASFQVKSDWPKLDKKIEEDDGGIGWNDIGDYMYGQRIPYRFQTAVPEIGGYKTYLMSFHDRMDPALDFIPDSVRITLDQDGESYTLQEGEYEILEPGGAETFEVRIPDIKAICDREFGRYGQTVTLRYDAKFNEQVLDRFEPGVNGFENTVRLEFSNDPDAGGQGQTGFTPWDTVVCYTYQLAGLKTNENSRPLEGAAFRVYEDEACTREIGFAASGDAWLPAKEGEDIVSGADGTFRLDGLDQGMYWLKEVRAPAGYRPLDAPIQIVIQPEFPTDRDSYVAGGQGLMGLNATADDRELVTVPEAGSVNLAVLNRTGSLLPSTGSSATVILLAAAGSLAAVGIWLGKRRR